jgi:hypothetical protein
MSEDALLGAGILLVCCCLSIFIGAYAASRGFERALMRMLRDQGIDPDEKPKD